MRLNSKHMGRVTLAVIGVGLAMLVMTVPNVLQASPTGLQTGLHYSAIEQPEPGRTRDPSSGVAPRAAMGSPTVT